MSEEKSTTKKTKVIGTQEYLNTTTGELEEMQIIRMEDKDFDFEKIWLGQILSAIDEISNQKMRLLTHLLKIREKSNNTVIRTIRELEKETGVSKDTICRTLVVLEKNKIIKRKPGVIFINPDVVFKGGHNNRMRIVFDYQKVAQEQKQEKPETNVVDFPNAEPITEEGDILGVENAA
jgi:DNA-binding GntR family transcriptional regulator